LYSVAMYTFQRCAFMATAFAVFFTEEKTNATRNGRVGFVTAVFNVKIAFQHSTQRYGAAYFTSTLLRLRKELTSAYTRALSAQRTTTSKFTQYKLLLENLRDTLFVLDIYGQRDPQHIVDAHNIYRVEYSYAYRKAAEQHAASSFNATHFTLVDSRSWAWSEPVVASPRHLRDARSQASLTMLIESSVYRFLKEGGPGTTIASLLVPRLDGPLTRAIGFLHQMRQRTTQTCYAFRWIDHVDANAHTIAEASLHEPDSTATFDQSLAAVVAQHDAGPAHRWTRTPAAWREYDHALDYQALGVELPHPDVVAAAICVDQAENDIEHNCWERTDTLHTRVCARGKTAQPTTAHGAPVNDTQYAAGAAGMPATVLVHIDGTHAAPTGVEIRVMSPAPFSGAGESGLETVAAQHQIQLQLQRQRLPPPQESPVVYCTPPQLAGGVPLTLRQRGEKEANETINSPGLVLRNVATWPGTPDHATTVGVHPSSPTVPTTNSAEISRLVDDVVEPLVGSMPTKELFQWLTKLDTIPYAQRIFCGGALFDPQRSSKEREAMYRCIEGRQNNGKFTDQTQESVFLKTQEDMCALFENTEVDWKPVLNTGVMMRIAQRCRMRIQCDAHDTTDSVESALQSTPSPLKYNTSRNNAQLLEQIGQEKFDSLDLAIDLLAVPAIASQIIAQKFNEMNTIYLPKGKSRIAFEAVTRALSEVEDTFIKEQGRPCWASPEEEEDKMGQAAPEIYTRPTHTGVWNVIFHVGAEQESYLEGIRNFVLERLERQADVAAQDWIQACSLTTTHEMEQPQPSVVDEKRQVALALYARIHTITEGLGSPTRAAGAIERVHSLVERMKIVLAMCSPVVESNGLGDPTTVLGGDTSDSVCFLWEAMAHRIGALIFLSPLRAAEPTPLWVFANNSSEEANQVAVVVCQVQHVDTKRKVMRESMSRAAIAIFANHREQRRKDHLLYKMVDVSVRAARQGDSTIASLLLHTDSVVPSSVPVRVVVESIAWRYPLRFEAQPSNFDRWKTGFCVPNHPTWDYQLRDLATDRIAEFLLERRAAVANDWWAWDPLTAYDPRTQVQLRYTQAWFTLPVDHTRLGGDDLLETHLRQQPLPSQLTPTKSTQGVAKLAYSRQSAQKVLADINANGDAVDTAGVPCTGPRFAPHFFIRSAGKVPYTTAWNPVKPDPRRDQSGNIIPNMEYVPQTNGEHNTVTARRVRVLLNAGGDPTGLSARSTATWVAAQGEKMMGLMGKTTP
jgi:hypothetical protein